jgi:hypothetical protein
VTRSVIISGTQSTADGSPVLLMQGTTPSVTGRTTKPRTLTLFPTEGPFLLQLDNLGLTVDGDGNLSPPQTTDPQYRVIF